MHARISLFFILVITCMHSYIVYRVTVYSPLVIEWFKGQRSDSQLGPLHRLIDSCSFLLFLLLYIGRNHVR